MPWASQVEGSLVLGAAGEGGGHPDTTEMREVSRRADATKHGPGLRASRWRQ